jgi:hypothetical protein
MACTLSSCLKLLDTMLCICDIHSTRKLRIIKVFNEVAFKARRLATDNMLSTDFNRVKIEPVQTFSVELIV